jgi:hypothetical protein
LVNRQAREISQFHNPCCQRVFVAESIESVIEGNQINGGRRRPFVALQFLTGRYAVKYLFPPSRIDENSPHGLSGRREKVAAIFPTRRVDRPDEA